MIGLGVTFSIAYNLAKRYKVDALSAGLIAISAFVILTPILQSEAGNGFPTKYLGSSGLFVGIIVSIVSTEMFQWFVKRNITIKMPDTVPPNVSRAFTAIVPGFFIILAWFFILIFLHYTGIDDIHALIANTIAKPLGLLTKTLPGIIFVILYNASSGCLGFMVLKLPDQSLSHFYYKIQMQIGLHIKLAKNFQILSHMNSYIILYLQGSRLCDSSCHTDFLILEK